MKNPRLTNGMSQRSAQPSFRALIKRTAAAPEVRDALTRMSSSGAGVIKCLQNLLARSNVN